MNPRRTVALVLDAVGATAAVCERARSTENMRYIHQPGHSTGWRQGMTRAQQAHRMPLSRWRTDNTPPGCGVRC